ncbi:GNAT family N-acetyltransferase [Robiginitalea sp. IMCC43444]|uniref:GNAT family N-acetyltransferase n=1 Tax=Robiginitalea sp. IMCC43444 TaxID=3459121 RepID=UPI004041CD07
MRKDEYSILKARDNDIEFILETIKLSFRTDLLIPTIYRARGANRYLQYLIKQPLGKQRIEIINYNRRKVGFLIYTMNSNSLFLDLIGIMPNEQGKGHGKFILDYLQVKSKPGPLGSIRLNVFESNQAAVKWYFSNGFEKEATRYLCEVSLKEKFELDNFYLLDYPKYKLQEEVFGFSKIKVEYQDLLFTFGQIEESLFFNDDFSMKALLLQEKLKRVLNKERCFFYSNDLDINENLILLKTDPLYTFSLTF